METKQNKHAKYQCPCCENYTLEFKANNTFQVCPICFWEDDGVQLNDPDYEGGANEMSLKQARMNYHKFGVIDLKFKDYTRAIKKDELP